MTPSMLGLVINAHAGFGAFISLALLMLDFAAMYLIITKAGYSSWWMMLPLSVLVTTVVLWIELSRQVEGVSVGFGFNGAGLRTIRILFDLDSLLVVVNYIFFLIFAFAKWPVIKQAEARLATPGAAKVSGLAGSAERTSRIAAIEGAFAKGDSASTTTGSPAQPSDAVPTAAPPAEPTPAPPVEASPEPSVETTPNPLASTSDPGALAEDDYWANLRRRRKPPE